MKKSFFNKILALIFICSFLVPVSFSLQSCGGSKMKYNKPRNGGRRVSSSGHVGFRRDRNRHVWGK